MSRIFCSGGMNQRGGGGFDQGMSNSQILFMIFSDLHFKPANVEIIFEVMTSYSSVLVTHCSGFELRKSVRSLNEC